MQTTHPCKFKNIQTILADAQIVHSRLQPQIEHLLGMSVGLDMTLSRA